MEPIFTERMYIVPLSDAGIRAKITAEADPEMQKAYGEMLAGCQKYPAQRLWYTVWQMHLRDSDRPIGDLCFKGLSADGSVEIGYGVEPADAGNGYATEAVIALTQWALAQPGVARVEAEAEPTNAASLRVLQKAGFVPNGIMGEEGPRFVWQGH